MYILHASPAGDTLSFKACIPCKLRMCVAGEDITQHKMKEVMGKGLSRYVGKERGCRFLASALLIYRN